MVTGDIPRNISADAEAVTTLLRQFGLKASHHRVTEAELTEVLTSNRRIIAVTHPLSGDHALVFQKMRGDGRIFTSDPLDGVNGYMDVGVLLNVWGWYDSIVVF